MQLSSSGPLEMLARLGYGARGVVYLIVGALAFQDAIGSGQSEDSKGALLEILAEPFGQTLLGIVAVGLVGYALWRFIQAVTDADHHGSNAKGLVIRAGLLVSAVTHVALAVFAASLIFGWGSGGGEGSTQDWTAKLLGQAYGRWLVAGLGAIVIGVGLAHFVKAWKATFRKYLAMEPDKMRIVSPICRFGLAARGVVFIIIGGFFIVAAVEFSSGKAKGLADALNALESWQYGGWLLGVVAVGLIAFGIYSVVEAAYRRINPPDVPYPAPA